MKPLVPPHVLEQVRLVAEQGMQTTITVRRRSVTVADSNNDYGDDDVVYTQTHETTYHTLKGWFYSEPTPVQVVDSGALVTVNTYRLFVPVGSDIVEGDEVVAGGQTYVVSDTTAESTWMALLRCSLRKRD